MYEIELVNKRTGAIVENHAMFFTETDAKLYLFYSDFEKYFQCKIIFHIEKTSLQKIDWKEDGF